MSAVRINEPLSKSARTGASEWRSIRGIRDAMPPDINQRGFCLLETTDKTKADSWKLDGTTARLRRTNERDGLDKRSIDYDTLSRRLIG